MLWNREEIAPKEQFLIAPKEQFLLFSTIFSIHLTLAISHTDNSNYRLSQTRLLIMLV